MFAKTLEERFEALVLKTLWKFKGHLQPNIPSGPASRSGLARDQGEMMKVEKDNASNQRWTPRYRETISKFPYISSIPTLPERVLAKFLEE